MFTTPLLLQTFRERREWSWGLDFDLTVITTTLFTLFNNFNSSPAAVLVQTWAWNGAMEEEEEGNGGWR